MYNNYGYNPYYQQKMPIQDMTPRLNGRLVESVDVVKALDISLDGSTNYFPLTDGSAIITKKMQLDGTSKTIIYKPVEEEKLETPKYITIDELDKRLNEFDDLEDEIKDIKKQLKDLKKSKED